MGKKSGSKAKRSSSDSKGSQDRKNRLGPDAVAMKHKAPKSNPFETIWSRRKFDILGKKRKGEERRVGLARSRAIDKRKNTLLKEYEQRGKSSVFMDKRIGEQNDELEEFDKAILRSQRERQLKLGKKSKYNLSDGEDDDLEIYGGGPFSERDDYEDEMLPDDDEDDGVDASEKSSGILKQLTSHNALESSPTGGEENRHKTKKEVMEEIILKSKFFKAQKAKDKEENQHLVDELDKNFTSLVQSEVLFSLTEPGKMNALKALVNQSIPKEQRKEDVWSTAQKPERLKQLEEPDVYDKLVKSMSLDIRARPSDRTKTPEETAQEERERLERLEEERQKRMLATDVSSDEDNDDIDKSSVQKPRLVSGDDLGDSFSLDEEQGTRKGWVDEILEREDEEDTESEDGDSHEELECAEDDGDEEGSDDDSDGCEKATSLKDWEQSDDDYVSSEDEQEEEEEDGEDHVDKEETMPQSRKMRKGSDEIGVKETNIDLVDAKRKKASDKQSSTKAHSLPCLIEAPKNFEELCALFESHDNADIILLINRIRASNAIALAAENRKKIQVFYGVLLQYFAVLANKKPLDFELLNLLVKPLMDMSVEIPYFAAICARQRILRIRTQFCEAVKNSESSCWPSAKTLFLLRLWSMIFPCSDFRHVVMTPTLLLMCEYLMRCPIVSGRDIATGSFLCSMVLSVVKQSRKFCPEAIMFLRTLLLAATDKNSESYQDTEFYHLMELKSLKPLLRICNGESEIAPLNFLAIMDTPDDSSFFSSDNFRASVLWTVVQALEGFVTVYGELSSFSELFSPIAALLHDMAQQEKVPNALGVKFEEVAKLIESKAEEHCLLRRPLQMRKQKPVPIKLLNPNFEENFVKGRDYDPDRERAERRKLKKLVKQEAKGAIRELRKDNHFLFEVKEKEKAQAEEERAEKYGKARAFLQEQEHAYKSGQLGKGKGKKRRR